MSIGVNPNFACLNPNLICDITEGLYRLVYCVKYDFAMREGVGLEIFL